MYPETVKLDSERIQIVEVLNEDATAHLNKGGKVLLTMDPVTVKADVQLGFSSILWNTAWTGGQAPHTPGILCNPKHPALERFPTEYHSNWQWSEPIQNAAVMELDHLPKELQPIVQVVPDWFAPKKLALVFEAKVGEGSLVACSVDIINDIDRCPPLRQLRYSLLRYMESDAFRPEVDVSIDQIRALTR